MLLLLACTAGDLGTRKPPLSTPVDSGSTVADSTPTPTPTGSTGSTGTPTPTGDTASTGTTADTAPDLPPRLFAYVGSGDAKIRVYTVDPADGALSFASDVDAGSGPSFLAFAQDFQHVYAVNEGTSELAAFSVDLGTGQLGFLNRVPSNGSGPAHLTVDATGGWLLAANYGGGTVSSVAIGGDGTLGAAATTLATGANAHQIVLSPDNASAFVPNLGDDDVSQLLFDPVTGDLDPNAVPSVAVGNGAGPRHLAFHPSAPYAYLIDETDDTMVAMAYDAALGRLTAIQTESTLPSGADAANSYCAEVAFGAGGSFLYGSNRGDDSLVIFAVDPGTGLLSLVGHQPTDGSWPRHFSLTPAGDLLLVGNQYDDEVVAFAVDPTDGTLTQLATSYAPSPAYVGLVDLPSR